MPMLRKAEFGLERSGLRLERRFCRRTKIKPVATVDEHDDEIRARAAQVNSAIERLERANRRVEAALAAVSHNSTPATGRVRSTPSSTERLSKEGDPLAICEVDRHLYNFRRHLRFRWSKFIASLDEVNSYDGGSDVFTRSYEKFGAHNAADGNGFFVCEWAPSASQVALIGDHNQWTPTASDMLEEGENGIWYLRDAERSLRHGDRFALRIVKPDGTVESRPSTWSRRIEWDESGSPVSVLWDPPAEESYAFNHESPTMPPSLRIYEAHIGLCSSQPKVTTFSEFREVMLPQVHAMGYNCILLVAVQQQRSAQSFGHEVVGLFGPDSALGKPEELKELIDASHGLGIAVMADLMVAQASPLALDEEAFSTEARPPRDGAGRLDMGKYEVRRMVLSAMRMWWEEFKLDGIRLPLGTALYQPGREPGSATNVYEEYFGDNVDVDSVATFMLANRALKAIRPRPLLTIVDEFSGAPGLARPVSEGGVGFDWRMRGEAAGKWRSVLSHWGSEEDWDISDLTHDIENRGHLERAIVYTESHHEHAMGGETLLYLLAGEDAHESMSALEPDNARIDRGIALHKLARMLSIVCGGDGWLSFMGSESGHPDTLVPRKGARRLDVATDEFARFKYLGEFERMINALDERFRFLSKGVQVVTRVHQNAKAVVVERGGVLFVFNFHPFNHLQSARVGAPHDGRWSLVLNSDQPSCGGYDELASSSDTLVASYQAHDGRPASFIAPAVPPRTVLGFASLGDSPPDDTSLQAAI